MIVKVWILMSVANDYNQPDKAFETLWWEKPTYEDLKPYGFSEEEAKRMRSPNKFGDGDYWVETFSKKI